MREFDRLKDKIARMATHDLHELVIATTDDVEIDEALDEIERRERDKELRDWTEQDRRAAEEERFEMWRNEY